MVENTPDPISPQEVRLQQAAVRKQRLIIAAAVAGVVLFLAACGLAVFFLLQPGAPTSTIRDIFIIFMAFESLLIGAAMVFLMIQVASLTNLLQNEVRPILKSTSETVNTLRGTTEFLSENMVEPVIKLNSYLAGLRKMLDLLNLTRK